jgi:hypothetical protein
MARIKLRTIRVFGSPIDAAELAEKLAALEGIVKVKIRRDKVIVTCPRDKVNSVRSTALYWGWRQA